MTHAEINIACAEAMGWGTCADQGELFAKWKHYNSGRLAKTDQNLPQFITSHDAAFTLVMELRKRDI